MFFKNKNQISNRLKSGGKEILSFPTIGVLFCFCAIFSFQKEIIVATLLMVGFCLLEEIIW